MSLSKSPIIMNEVRAMKRCLSLLLAVLFVMLPLAACSGDQTNGGNDADTTAPGDGHPLYFRGDKDLDDISATFSSTRSEATKTVDLSHLEDEENAAIYCCYAPTEEFDRVTVTLNGRDTELLAFNDYTSGWEYSSGRIVPFTYGQTSAAPTYERRQFPYQDRNKDVLIWTPKDYDKKSPAKYSVIYMTDGHNLFEPTATSYGSWGVAESAEAMMSQSKNNVIIVGIENIDGWRDDELTPDLGTPTDPGYEDGHGAYFCDFLMKTVIPYVESNYNVYTDREHTAICGSSSGGIESFYIAMEHPEKFGAVGALSPAFSLYDDATWQKYLGKKDFSAGYPRLYFYCGGGADLESVLLPGMKSMPSDLEKIGYPAENISSVVYDKGLHNELYWRIVFPDFLKFLFS